MRHAPLILGMFGLGVLGCGGGGGGGEPITGTIAMQYGDSSPALVVGSAIQSSMATNMLVQIGSDNVDCDTNLVDIEGFEFPKGSFVYFDVAKAPGSHPTAGVTVMKSTSDMVNINGSTGMVTIDSAGDRVTGSVTFTTTDNDVGTISVSGTFDVLRCF
ncbi:MAG: hypothetical protein H0T89_00510 [Deltaproteobacteria bacterium]|nr:hypothetical protein [Deltaproteobacteria bacterium]MDQ3300370.1 hypothetical protein [Myxococcota bacterium]